MITESFGNKQSRDARLQELRESGVKHVSKYTTQVQKHEGGRWVMEYRLNYPTPMASMEDLVQPMEIEAEESILDRPDVIEVIPISEPSQVVA